MSKDKRIYTCYGCQYYYRDKIAEDEDGYARFKKYPRKHCGQDHFKCPYFLGNGKPLPTIYEKGEEYGNK